MWKNYLSISLLASLMQSGSGFYLPGVAPKDFLRQEKVELKVNKLTSFRTQVPFDYYSLPFCQPTHIKQANENLGEFLKGDRIENSDFQIFMRTESYCKVLCQIPFNGRDAKKMQEAIKNEYHVNWIVDNLPAAAILDADVNTYYETFGEGFPIGFEQNGRFYIYNHVVLHLSYHTVDDEHFRVVRFEVEPLSVKHLFAADQWWDGSNVAYVPPLLTCNEVGPLTLDEITQFQPVEKGETILYTYDVTWEESDVKWASRWDIYLTMDDAIPDKVHWFSIINSLLIVLFLSGTIGMILFRNIHRDILKYNRLPTDEEKEEEREESGWKLVHADVFRPPVSFPMLYCVLNGTGAQLMCMALATIVFSWLGFLSPANRGSLMIAFVLLYVLMGSFAGYSSAKLYKTFKGKLWQRCTLVTAFLFPAICFTIFFVLDIMLWSYGSTEAVPVSTMLSILVLWFFISIPLVFLGAYFGYKSNSIEYPVHSSNIPRQIPDQPWYLTSIFACLIGGVLPFGACFVEVFFILSSMWMGKYYYVFGFLLLVFVILLVTCAEMSIVLCYFQLCSENYHWWWRSFLASASTGIYLFLYSAIYFMKLEPSLWITYLLYFGYMGMICLGVGILCGSAGFVSTLWFVRKIYGSIKVD